MREVTAEATRLHPLDERQAALVAEIRAKAEGLEHLIKKVRNHLDAQGLTASGDVMLQAQPHRWLAIGTTDLQTGLMALTRAVTQPTTF